MTTLAATSQVHDMALAMVAHLKSLEDSPEKTAHIFRMICAVERAAAGVLDEVGAEQAMKDIEAAALFCQS
jgi:hypothetical protein